MEQLNNIAFPKQTISDIRSTSILLVPEGNKSLIFMGKDSEFTSKNKMAFNDICLLLRVYICCFYAHAFPMILNILSRYEKSVRCICDKNISIYSSRNVSFLVNVVNKDYISILSFFLRKG